MDSSDILGDDGREAVFAVIKVSVLKKKPRTFHQAVSEFMNGRGREIPNDLDQIPNDKCPFKIPVAEDRSEGDYEEVDYGSGFIIRNKLIITAYHVVADATENSAVEMEIRVSNARINGLKCQVVKCDEQNDLALLKCEELDVKEIGISPLQLSTEAPLQGMSVFTLGYPVSHTGKTALFLNGCVAGETGERHGRPHPLITLNIPLDCGSSGAPVFWRCKGELSVVAVVKEKHLKRVSSCWEEESLVEKVRSSLNTFSTDTIYWDLQAALGMLRIFASLMDKWLDSSEKNCQRYLSNAVRADFVSDLLNKQ